MTDDSPPPPRRSLYQRGKGSRRRLTATRRLLYRLAAPLAVGILRGWWAMLRRRQVIGAGHLRSALAEHGAVIPVYWHDQQLVPVRHLLDQAAHGMKLGFLISPSVDGELPAMLVQRAGGVVIRGSSNSSGARALRDYYEAIARQGVSPAITPDGPRGPPHVCKPGPILISQLSGRPIVAMSYAASRTWRFPTWDRFVLPWPFARVVLLIGEPRLVPRGLDAAGLQRWQAELGAELDRLHGAAEAALLVAADAEP